MLHQRGMAVFIVFFLFAFIEARNETFSDSDCVLADIESHLGMAFQIIDSAKGKIPKVLLENETGNQTKNNSKCVLADIKAHLKVASQLIETAKRKIPKDLKQLCKIHDDNNCKKCENITCDAKPVDCSDIFLHGAHKDGLYEIWPEQKTTESPLQVYCDMESNDGGWTVIQRRGDYGSNKDHFFRGWKDYKRGFGDNMKDFWIGNDNLFALTNQRNYELRVNLTAWESETAFATYDEFRISDEKHNYTLHVKGYHGTAGDSLKRHSGKGFTTKDRVNTKNGVNCADTYKGSWWYADCADSSLNGLYLGRGKTPFGEGIFWENFKGYYYSLRDTVMKIRPLSFRS